MDSTLSLKKFSITFVENTPRSKILNSKGMDLKKNNIITTAVVLISMYFATCFFYLHGFKPHNDPIRRIFKLCYEERKGQTVIHTMNAEVGFKGTSQWCPGFILSLTQHLCSKGPPRKGIREGILVCIHYYWMKLDLYCPSTVTIPTPCCSDKL